jgi:hypothetical protein
MFSVELEVVDRAVRKLWASYDEHSSAVTNVTDRWGVPI